MPYYKEQLLSSWSSHLVFEVGSPPPKIDSTILNSMTRAEIGFFAKNPKTKRRNQAEATRHIDKVSESLSAPKFLSEKTRAGARERQKQIELARQRKDAICVGLHPGTVDTGLSRPFQAGVDPDRLFTSSFAAERLLAVINALEASQSGQLIAWDGSTIAP